MHKNIENNTANENVKTKRKSKNKIVIKDKKKFILAISIFLLFIIAIVTFISLNLKVDITSDTDISSLNAKKYKKEIKLEYEKNENELLFIKDWENVQNNVGKYFIEHYSNNKNEVDNMIKNLNNVLSSNDWNTLDVKRPIKWNGTWKIDNDGNVIFKFENKYIEPSWAVKLSNDKKIELN